MLFKRKILKGDNLYHRAEELGVSLIELGYADGTESEPELQRRVLEAERALRENRLWIIALISAIASVISALAAWFAVLGN